MELARYWLRSVNVKGDMRNQKDMKRLQRQVAKAKALVRQTAMKVEELEASVEEIYSFKERIVMFPRPATGQHPVRVDKSKDVGDFQDVVDFFLT
jgi:hypothetical protein